MYLRHTFAIAMMLLMSFSVLAENFVCMHDFDGSGDMTQQGETANCIATGGGQLCPLDSAQCTVSSVCPIDPTLPCTNGSCSTPQACQPHGLLVRCPETGVVYRNSRHCNRDCVQQRVCVPGNAICPLSNGGQCLQQQDGSFACSAMTCEDLDLNPPVVTNLDDRVYTDDGQRDAQGQCMDQIMIYSGRSMSCDLAGKSTAWKNCCQNTQSIMTDSTGSVAELAVAGAVISGTFSATKAAFTTYRAGQDLAKAADAFTNAFKAAVDPATLALNLALSATLNYFLNNCSEHDMETSLLNASGRCYEVGQPYCKTEWFGECVQESQAYCCFNSKMGRIVHEHGRPQLTSFANEPIHNCRGFYPEEFQHIDFSQIDLTEYYGDLQRKSQSDINATIETKTNDVMNTLHP